jgi:cation-transporting ATPase I
MAIRQKDSAANASSGLALKLRTLLHDIQRTVLQGDRRIVRGEQRLYFELREATADELEDLAPEIEAAVNKLPGVKWATVNIWFHWIAVGYDAEVVVGEMRSARARTAAFVAFEDRVAAAIDEVEKRHGRDAKPFPAHAHPEQHPGDLLPLLRTALELALHSSVLASARFIGRKHAPFEVGLGALLEMFNNTPELRAWLERQLGVAWTEIGLEAGGAVLQALQGSNSGAVTRVLYRGLRLRELAARRRVWRRWEPRLAHTKAHHAGAPYRCRERRRPLPEGPIEHYLERVVPGAMGAFAGALLATRHAEQAAATIFAGLPRPARLARNTFASQLSYRLSQKGVLVMDPRVLRQLDRLSTLVISAELAQDEHSLQRLLGAAKQARLECVIVGTAPAPGRIPAKVRYILQSPSIAISLLQDEGHAVLFLHRGRAAKCAIADCDVAVAAWKDEPAWGAHLHLPGGIHQAVAIIDAVHAARQASEQSLAVSMAETAFATVLSSAGFDEKKTRQVAFSGNVAGMLAMANSIRLVQSIAWPDDDDGSNGGARSLPPWHSMPPEAVVGELQSRLEGLTQNEALQRREPTAREPTATRRLLSALAEELNTPMVPILGAGAGLALLSGAPIDAALIALVLLVNGGFGGMQRFRAEQTIHDLLKRERHYAWVRRPGERQRIGADELVPGDIVELSTGDVVPADCRILEAKSLEVDEASLTGESLPVAKGVAPSDAEAIAERSSMLYAGTNIAAGKALAIVVAAGRHTEIGRATVERPATTAHFAGAEARLHELTKQTLPVAASSAIVLAILARQHGRSMPEALSIASSLALAAVPEGLPLLAGLAQAVAAERLSHRGALVRNSRAVEALGRIDVLCCDKTGTLTEGRIRLHCISDGTSVQTLDRLDGLRRHILAAALRASPSRSSGEPMSHATDQALIEAAQKTGIGSHDDFEGWRRLDQMPFQSSRPFHVGLAVHNGGKLISVKGAPEVVLKRCSAWHCAKERVPLDKAQRRRLDTEAETLARRGYRLLAVAEREMHEPGTLTEDHVNDLDFLGFLALADEVRPTARDALAQLRQAGIQVVMLTGDHPDTAAAIAAELDLAAEPRVLSGVDIDHLSDEALTAAAADVHVFARVTPAHKVRIVRALRDAGRAVGMTGDGANDASAIRLADAGIALGERSTAAARSAADLIVPDGRIETVVACVLEGRGLWQGLREATSLLLGGNLGEVLFTLGSGIGSGTAAFSARQLLLLNLLSDTLPALTLALRPHGGQAAADLLRAGPEASLGKSLKREIAVRGAITAASAGISWTAARLLGGRAKANSVALLAITGSQMLQASLLGRGDRSVLLSSLASAAALTAIVETPGLSQLFGCRPVGPLGLLQAGAGAACGAVAQWLLPGLGRRETRPSIPRVATENEQTAHLRESRLAPVTEPAEPRPVRSPSGKPKKANGKDEVTRVWVARNERTAAGNRRPRKAKVPKPPASQRTPTRRTTKGL